MSKVIAPKNGYWGNYGGFEFVIGAGSAVTFLADGSTMPTGEGAAAILKNPLSGPDQGAEVTPVAVTLPVTPGPLDVTAVDLPDVTVTGPAGATFDINVLTGLATPVVPSSPSPSAAPSS